MTSQWVSWEWKTQRPRHPPNFRVHVLPFVQPDRVEVERWRQGLERLCFSHLRQTGELVVKSTEVRIADLTTSKNDVVGADTLRPAVAAQFVGQLSFSAAQFFGSKEATTMWQFRRRMDGACHGTGQKVANSMDGCAGQRTYPGRATPSMKISGWQSLVLSLSTQPRGLWNEHTTLSS